MKYFKFEEDFIEENVRCIPMIVRFKLDACGIKMKLNEWSKLTTDERVRLAEDPCHTTAEVQAYRQYVVERIKLRANQEATDLAVDQNPPWARTDDLPSSLSQKLTEANLSVSVRQWNNLDTLQRFALTKLSGSSHESKNFIKAVKEFELI